jgi:hypothetical protein
MKLQELICDRQGRFNPVLVHFHLWTAAVLTMWVIACVKAGTLVPVDLSILGLLGISSGTVLGASLAERKNEP